MSCLFWSLHFTSALHMACGGQHADSVEVLLKYGATDEVDSSGVSASSLARKSTVKKLFESDTRYSW